MLLGFNEEIYRAAMMREGIEEGRAEGRAEVRKEAIVNLYMKGMALEEIHEQMDYPMEEIEAVVKELRENGAPS